MTSGTRSEYISVSAVAYPLAQLPRDFRRVLRVQLKELLHELDEATGQTPGHADRGVRERRAS